MHCPHCRHDNAPTTRFCTSCGAVLVEEAPGGGRRRVLRPWGLRRSAPPTIGPDFPDYNLPAIAKTGVGRLEMWLAGAVIVVVATLAGLHSWRAPSRAAPADAPPIAAAPATEVAVATVTQAREARLMAPALVETPAVAPVRDRPVAVAPPPLAPPSPRFGAPRGVASVPAAFVAPAREIVIGDGQSAEPQPAADVPPPVPVPAADRWQPLRDSLARCQSLALLERAACEQGTRLAHCDGQWGNIALCPAGRTEFGQ